MSYLPAPPADSSPFLGLSGLVRGYRRNKADISVGKAGGAVSPASAPAIDFSELNGTIERRRSLVEMAVHDIRSPLMSSQISIDLVEELSLQISAEGYTTLLSARLRLKRTLQRAESLLSWSKKSNPANRESEPSGKEQARLALVQAGSSTLCFSKEMFLLTQELRSELADSLKFLQRFEFLEGRRLSSICLRHLSRAQSGIKTCLAILKDLLPRDSRRNNPLYLEKAPCSVRALAEEAAASMKNLADQKQIRIVQQCASAFVQADRDRIARILVNYLSNAIKYSPANTEIVLSCRVLEGRVRFAVSDRGPGISTEAVAHIFEKFSRACEEQDKQGFGLGLSICKSIAEAHGGRVGVETEAGRGSTFFLELPA